MLIVKDGERKGSVIRTTLLAYQFKMSPLRRLLYKVKETSYVFQLLAATI